MFENDLKDKISVTLDLDQIMTLTSYTCIASCIHLVYNIYILGVLTEKPYSKPLERNVVYIPIITLSHAMSHDFK